MLSLNGFSASFNFDICTYFFIVLFSPPSRLFHSGTHYEREALVRRGLPRLRDFCERRNISLVFVDLRHRADTEKNLDLSKAVEAALRVSRRLTLFV